MATIALLLGFAATSHVYLISDAPRDTKSNVLYAFITVSLVVQILLIWHGRRSDAVSNGVNRKPPAP